VSSPHRGEIWWGEMEQVGRRPYLVLSREAVLPVIQTVVVAPVTRSRRGIPSELELGEADGMPVASVATFDNIQAVPKSGLIARITVLDPLRMREACAALRAAVDC
jgi:mRNA interferase MazF